MIGRSQGERENAKSLHLQLAKHVTQEDCRFYVVVTSPITSWILRDYIVVVKPKEFGGKLDFRYSCGWLDQFKTQYGIKQQVIHRESGKVDESEV